METEACHNNRLRIMQNESWLLDMIKFLITPLMCIALYLLCCRRKWPCTQEEESDDSSIYVIPMHEEERTEGRREEPSPPSRPPRPSRAPTPPPLPTTVYRPPYRQLPPYSSVDLINPAPPYTPFDPKDPEDVPPSYRVVIEDIPPVYSAVVVSDDLPSVWYPPLPPVSPPYSQVQVTSNSRYQDPNMDATCTIENSI